MRGETVRVGAADVGNVLVEPGLSKDMEKTDVPTGARVDYTLRFPASADAPDPDDKVTVRGNVLDVLNVPDHWNPADVFGEWSNPFDMTVLVGKTLGDFTATAEVIAITATVDELGDPVTVETTVYSGAAQARMKSGGTSGGTAVETDATEIWAFVIPWQVAFEVLRPQAALIAYNGERYEVRKIENIDNKSEFAAFEAVRRFRPQHSGSSGIPGA